MRFIFQSKRTNNRGLAIAIAASIFAVLATVSPSIANASSNCQSGGACSVGDTGPGGGTVFYDAGSTQSWGRYLEVAPSSWTTGVSNPNLITGWESWRANSDPGLAISMDLGDLPNRPTSIGSGAANTEAIYRRELVRSGLGSAATAVKSYAGTDGSTLGQWFIPSLDELSAMCAYFSGVPVNQFGGCSGNAVAGLGGSGSFSSDAYNGALGAYYWSSSSGSATGTFGGRSVGQTYMMNMSNGVASSDWHDRGYFVRPIRAFVEVPPTPGLAASFGLPNSTTDGFTLQISNYDSNFSWSGTNSAGGSVSISNTGLVTVTGLAPGTSSTVTISTNRYGYYNASSTSGATAALKASQAQIAITNSILTSPANSSVNLTAVGGSGSGTTTFNVIGTGCILSGSSNDVLSTAKSGDCVVTANNPGDATYLPTSSSPVTFTFSPISQTLPVSITNTTLTSQNGSSIALAASGGSGIGDYSFSTSSAGCIITNSSLTRPTTGSCSVVATRSASGIYAAATSAPTTFTFGPALNQAKLAISNTARSATASSAIGLTTSGGTGAGAVSYAVSGGTAGATGSRCVINGSTLSTTQSGTCIVVATKAANGYYNATSSAAVTFTFTAIAQSTLTLNPTAISGTAGIPVGLGVLGGSGSGNYTFSTSTAGCTAVTTDAVAGTGTLVRSASTGSCSVTATHAASGIYSAASSAAVTITFSAAPQSNVLLSPATSTGTAGTAIALTASGGSGAGAYSFASSTSGCTVTTTNSASGTGTINRTTATGICSITATKAANGIYASATSAPVVVTFSAATQATLNISNSNTANIAKGTTGITLAATGGSGTGAVTYAVTGTGCTLSGSKLTVATTYLAGTKVSCSVVATKAASGIYGAVSSIAKVFNYL